MFSSALRACSCVTWSFVRSHQCYCSWNTVLSWVRRFFLPLILSTVAPQTFYHPFERPLQDCYLSIRSQLAVSYNLGQKSWDAIAFLGRFPIHKGPTPPLTPQTMLDACVQNFLRVSTMYRVGGERNARKFRKGCTVLRGNREVTEKYEYCSTVPRTFVQVCRLTKSRA